MNVHGSRLRTVRVLLTCLATAAVLFLGRDQASAAPIDPQPAAAVPSPLPGAVSPRPVAPAALSFDEGLGPRQFAYGSLGAVGTVVLGLSLAFAAIVNDGQESAETILGVTGWVAPMVAGLVVCRVGRSSRVYDGRCFPAVLGAYVGGVAMIPLGVLAIFAGCVADNSSDEGCVTSIVASVVLGSAIGPPLGALIGWNISKRPKDTQPAPPPHSFAAAEPAGFASLHTSAKTPWAEDLQQATRREFASSSSSGMRLRLTVLAFSF